MNTVQEWKEFFKNLDKKDKTNSNICKEIVYKMNGKMPFFANLISWTFGLLCCIPCILNSAKNSLINQQIYALNRAWVLFQYEEGDVYNILKSALDIIEKEPILLLGLQNINPYYISIYENNNQFGFLDVVSEYKRNTLIAAYPILVYTPLMVDLGISKDILEKVKNAINHIKTF